MRARDLISQFRVEVADPLVPGGNAATPDEDSLWKDSELLGYLNEAQREVVRRTYPLFGRRRFPVRANDPYVRLPDDYMAQRRVRLLDSRYTLTAVNANELEQQIREDYGARSYHNWENAGPGQPNVAVFDDSPGEIRLVPEPAEDDTLELLYFRWPDLIERMSTPLDLDHRHYMRAMLHWMKVLAYRKQDADAMDLERAQVFGLEFQREVDRIYGEQRREHRRPGTVRYGGL